MKWRLGVACALVLAVSDGRAWPAPAVPAKAPKAAKPSPKAFDVPLATKPDRKSVV